MNNLKVLVIGGSRNIGYLSALRLLEYGATVTFLLRSPGVFDADKVIQKYIEQSKARLVKGDALVRTDVEHAWDEAAKGDDSPVDLCLFTVGGTPQFQLTKGIVMSPPNLVTQSLLNVLSTLPASTPASKLIAISSAGLTHASHAALPLLLRPLYSYLLAEPHKDKCGAECLVAHCAGWMWNDPEPGEEILPKGWKDTEGLPAAASYQRVVVIRPALFTDGECKADKGKGYRVKEGELGAYTVSRKDVAHFVVEGVIKHWDEWEGKGVNIAY